MSMRFIWRRGSQLERVPIWSILRSPSTSSGTSWKAQETIHVSGIGEPGEHGTPHYGLDFTPVNEPAHGGVRMWMWPLPTRWMDGCWSWDADDSSYRDGERREVRRRWASRRTHRFK